ncbi:MAG: carboxypeptidase-like regulatory domain-containing protein [Methanobacteriota archaeon]
MGRPTTHPLVASLAALALALSGCLSGQSGDAETIRRLDQPAATAVASTGLGGIQGLVTDAAVVPIGGAKVSLVEAGFESTVAPDGSFAFSLLAPGLYTLVVNAEGYHLESRPVTVEAGRVTVVDFVLTRIAVEVPRVDVLEFAGFQECAFLVGWDLRGTLPDPMLPYDARFFFAGLTVCSLPNSALGSNATNDKFLFTFGLAPNAETIVAEMDWKGASPAAGSMSFPIEVSGINNDDSATFAEPVGKPPLQAVIPRDRILEIDANLTENCEDVGDQYCGFDFANAGGEIQIRAFPWLDCLHPAAGGCANFQQPFNVFVSLFYNRAAPLDYTLLG